MQKGSKILIVEDEDSYRLVLKKILEDNGFIIMEAMNGAAGLEIMRTSRVDLAIVDLEMPIMDGMEFTKWVKEIDPKFPVIIVTAHERNFSPLDIISTNVEAFIHKPFEISELIQTIESIERK
jgi:CheY-like chemotaxis protein